MYRLDSIKPSRQCWNHLDSIEIIQTELKLSRQFEIPRIDSRDVYAIRCSNTVWTVLNHPDSVEVTRTEGTKAFWARICVVCQQQIQQQLNQEINRAIYEEGLRIT